VRLHSAIGYVAPRDKLEGRAECCWDVSMNDVIRIDQEGYVHGPTKLGLGFDVDW
jgi:hypothetical protein